MRKDVIAIDGPAGSGKSTVAKLLANRLGYFYVDTGAMYRALTLKALRRRMDFNDETALVALARDTDIRLERDGRGSLKVSLDGRDVSSRIRGQDINSHISRLSRMKKVRENMVSRQRALCARGGAVLEGRDIGTVVFPDAEHKFYIDADFRERVNRRYKEFSSQGKKISWVDVRKDLLRRDRSDKLRKVAPLKKAKDAIYIDTTNLSINEAVEKILLHIRQKKA